MQQAGLLFPFTCEGLLRVGGRLQHSEATYGTKHPIILPNSHHVTSLLIEEYYCKVGHSRASFTWSSLRQHYWILRRSTTVRKVTGKCLQCKKRNAKSVQQIMADLPKERFAVNKPPFFCTGVDYFGPYLVKQGLSLVKRCECLFTSLTTRAVHLEIFHYMSSSQTPSSMHFDDLFAGEDCLIPLQL